MSYFDEVELIKSCKAGQINGAFRPKKASLDELILAKVFEATLPDAAVEHQALCGRTNVDLLVTVGPCKKYVEFLGPMHFKPPPAWSTPNDLERRDRIQDLSGFECVLWPYWIQRCSNNVRAIFDPSIRGIASVWSTTVHFGDFTVPDPDNLIVTLTDRFGAIDGNGLGYIYGNSRVPKKPIHPVVEQIRRGRTRIGRLIPRGDSRASDFWLPSSLSTTAQLTIPFP